MANTLNEEQKNSLSIVIDYLEDDEEKHFQEEECPDDHIYNHLMILKKFLE